MNQRDLDRFQKLLRAQRESLLENQSTSLAADGVDPDDLADEVDTASSATTRRFDERLRERELGLLHKIEQALGKIEEGRYGECESCGEQIAIARLRARPVAELCIECKSEQERREGR